jgi:acyl-CoA thioesterase
MFDAPKTFMMRPVMPNMFAGLEANVPRLAVWVKTTEPIGECVECERVIVVCLRRMCNVFVLFLGDDDRLHHCVAGYISDTSMLFTALLPHVIFTTLLLFIILVN